jgi:hypothetical protein
MLMLGCKSAPTPPAPQGPAASQDSAAPAPKDVSSAAVDAASAHPLGRGDKAPAFSLQGSDGKMHALADHAGKDVVVVAWFPKAFTGG